MSKICQNPTCDRNCYGEFCLMHKPRKRIKSNKPLPKIGTQHKKWALYRKKWKELHKDEAKYCHICGKFLANGTFTLDHVIPRSRRPDLVFEDSNIKPACWICNGIKGSQSMERLKR